MSAAAKGKTIRSQTGFTLIEVAIVLIIIGLLLGGILKGNELMTVARVRALISHQQGIKAAYFGFRDRFRAYPGDYSAASANLSCAPACSNGDGNGRITGIADTPAAPINEYIAVWEHLSNSGFLIGSYTYAATDGPTTTPINLYGTYAALKYDAVYDGAPTARHNLKTGNQIPSDILAEVDRKIDDSDATTGAFRFSAFRASGVTPTGSGSCYIATAPKYWAMARQVSNCGAASLL